MTDFLQRVHEKDLARRGTCSGFLLLYRNKDHFPSSQKYLADTLHSIQEQERRLITTLGVTPKVGLEVEFATYKTTVGESADHWKDVKAKILAGMNPADPDYQAVADFGPREVMIYDLLHLDARTKELLEPLAVTGYFDGGDMMELKLKPVMPSQMTQHLDSLAEALYDKAVHEYGLVFYEGGNPGYHVNLSFWDDKGNLLEQAHPDFSRKGKAVVESLLRGIYDSYSMQLDNKALLNEIPDRCSLTVDRTGAVRFAKGRAEIRPTKEDKNFDPLLLLSIGMAGAEHALQASGQKRPLERHLDRGYILPVRQVQKAGVEERTDDLKVVAHVLNGALIESDRTLSIPESYVREKAERLAEQLGLIVPDYMHESARDMMRMFGQEAPYTQGLVDFFKQVAVAKTPGGKYRIVWPETGHDRYSFDGAKEEGQACAPRYTIDVGRLKTCMPTLAAYPAFVSDGYDLGAGMDGAADILDARQRRLRDSPILAHMDPQVLAGMEGDLQKRVTHVSTHAANALRQFSKADCRRLGLLITTGRPEHTQHAARLQRGGCVLE